MTTDDICDELEREADAPHYDVMIRAATELRQTRKERDEARNSDAGWSSWLTADKDRTALQRDLAAAVKERDEAIGTASQIQVLWLNEARLPDVEAELEDVRGNLAAAVALLRGWVNIEGGTLDKTRAFLEAVEKREGGR